MTTFFKNHSTIILMSVLLILLVLARVFPSAGLRFGIAFLLFSFFIASLAVLEKHQQAYRQALITREIFIRNAALEITGTWMVMLIAGVLARYVAHAATQQIGHDLMRVITGVLIGLLVGIGVGTFARRTWRRLIKV
jgi:hypothetical protein